MEAYFPYCSSKMAFTMSAFASPLNCGAYPFASAARSAHTPTPDGGAPTTDGGEQNLMERQ